MPDLTMPDPSACPLPRTSLLRRRLLCALGGAALSCTLPAWAARPITVEGTTFSGDITLAGAPLQLNGVGLRAVAWLKGYAAGLYLPRKASTPAQVLAQTGAKRLQLRMLQDVPAEEFVKALHKGVERNTPAADAARLSERVARFDAVVRTLGKLRKQEVIDLDFLPGRGLQLSRNGTPRGETIPGEDFYAALLRIFIGERPADPDMKVGLLGGPVG
jgi:hypothetical protein